MKVKYFEETDTLFIELSGEPAVDTRDLNENVSLDLDKNGRVVSITIEHSRVENFDLSVSFEKVAA